MVTDSVRPEYWVPDVDIIGKYGGFRIRGIVNIVGKRVFLDFFDYYNQDVEHTFVLTCA